MDPMHDFRDMCIGPGGPGPGVTVTGDGAGAGAGTVPLFNAPSIERAVRESGARVVVVHGRAGSGRSHVAEKSG